MSLIGQLIPFFKQGNAPEYIKRTKIPYAPPKVSYHDIQAAIPKRLHHRSLWKGLWLAGKDYLVAAALIWVALRIEPISSSVADTLFSQGNPHEVSRFICKSSLWMSYWWFMGLVGGGIWFNGHESGHGSLTEYNWINDSVGLFLHMTLMNPYFSWKISHKMHHKGSASMEKEENNVPKVRSDYLSANPMLEAKVDANPSNASHTLVEKTRAQRQKKTGDAYALVLDALEETPAYMLATELGVKVTMGWIGYQWINANGNKRYPPGTNHFNPKSALFLPHQELYVLLSDVAVAVMAYTLYSLATIYGAYNLFLFYGIPYLICNFVLVWVTVLQHSDATIPHFRGEAWNYYEGNLSTVDRPFLGWQGKFFLHYAGHGHLAHHLFPQIACYLLPEVTDIIKPMLGDSYAYDSTPTLYALWRTFHECQFVEDDGGVLFYKDRLGHAKRGLATSEREAAVISRAKAD